MASKKGIGITVAILVGIVGASFLVYLIPEDTTMKFVVSDFEKHLDDIDERSSMLSAAIEESFEDLMNNEISETSGRNFRLTAHNTPEEYEENARGARIIHH